MPGPPDLYSAWSAVLFDCRKAPIQKPPKLQHCDSGCSPAWQELSQLAAHIGKIIGIVSTLRQLKDKQDEDLPAHVKQLLGLPPSQHPAATQWQVHAPVLAADACALQGTPAAAVQTP